MSLYKTTFTLVILNIENHNRHETMFSLPSTSSCCVPNRCGLFLTQLCADSKAKTNRTTFSAASLRRCALTFSVIRDNNKRSTKPFCFSYVRPLYCKRFAVGKGAAAADVPMPQCVTAEHMRDNVMQTMSDAGLTVCCIVKAVCSPEAVCSLR